MKYRTLEKVNIYESDRLIKKKPYSRPEFRAYGSLHLHTQGNNSLAKNDSGGSFSGKF